MKNKPVSHKNENTFRFLSFAERLSSVSIDVIRRVGKTSENPEDTNTFFHEAVEKWNDLNYTEDYVSLTREIGFEITTLSQIVYRKDEIVDILLKHLENPESMALDAALEFTVALARDLQFEFYPVFPKFFRALTHLLETKDAVLLERIFTSLSYLFKFLWRYMVKDMKNVYRLYSSLLSDDNKEHIRNFAAESFAFLIRKLQDKQRFFEYMFHLVTKNPELSDGVGRLLFEVVKGVKQQLHSCTKQVFRVLLDCLKKSCFKESNSMATSHVEHSLSGMLVSVQKHAVKEHVSVIEEVFSESLMELHGFLKDGVAEKEPETSYLTSLLHLLHVWIDYREAHFLLSGSGIAEVLCGLCELKCLPCSCEEAIVEIITLLLLWKHHELNVPQVNLLLSYVYSRDSRHISIIFTRNMFKYSMFEKDVLLQLLSYCARAINKDRSHRKDVLHIMSETVVNLRPWHSVWEDVNTFIKLHFFTPTVNGTTASNVPLTLEECFLRALEEPVEDENATEKMSEAWCSLVCLPHFRSLDMERCNKALLSRMEAYRTHLLTCDSSSLDERKDATAYMLCQAFVSWICLSKKQNILAQFHPSYFTDLINVLPNSVCLLKMLAVYLHCLSDSEKAEVSETIFSAVESKLIRNLASPFHLVRLFTLVIICSLNFPLECADEDGEVTEKRTVFTICLEAEKVPLSVYDYREKLKWLRKLEYPFSKKHMVSAIQEQSFQACVYYLLGNLYINFSLLWQPVTDLLSTYANGSGEEFWKAFKPHFYDIIDLAEKARKNDFLCMVSSTDESEATDESLFVSVSKAFYHNPESPDVFNHRGLLWKAMNQFPALARQKNVDIVPLLFRYIQNEVASVDTSIASTETVSMSQAGITQEDALLSAEKYELSDEDEEDEGEEEEEHKGTAAEESQQNKKLKLDENLDVHQAVSTVESQPEAAVTEEGATDANMKCGDDSNCIVPEVNNDIEHDTSMQPSDTSKTENISASSSRKRTKSGEKPVAKKRRLIIKTLASILSLFSKFKKPRSLHMTEDLQALYYELLSYQDAEIQKLSFDCIMTYNYSYLVPYKDNFYRILDNKTFKSEIVLFNPDKDNEVILEKHRMEALAVLMRILYGKMLHKTGSNTAGKAQAHTRKTLVLRFLAGCKAEELWIFLELAFAPFKAQLNGDALSVVQNIHKSINLSAVVPIRKMRSALNTLEIILLNLGSLVPELLPWFLKVLLVIAATGASLLERREELLPYCVPLIKAVRKQVVMVLIKFFRSFEHYEFSREEIDAIFEAVVWPVLPRLEHEALNVPPPLLRLFDTWCSNSRYFILLAKHHPSTESLSPLPHLMSLYTSQRARPRVICLISKMILQLLTLPDCSVDDLEQMCSTEIKITNCLPLADVTEGQGPATFGVRLLFPHVQSILKRLQVIVAKASRNTKRSLDSRELNILLRISSYVEDGDQCTQLIQLLIPFFSHKQKLAVDCEVLVLSTIRSLIQHVENPNSFTSSLAPLFSTLFSQRSRSELVSVFSSMAQKDKALQKLSEIVRKINAWNPDMMEEPDYQTRLDGHSEALATVNAMSEHFDTDFVCIIIYNSAFMIRTCDDLSLRDSASYLLQQLTKKFSVIMETNPSVFKCLVFDTLLPEVQKGLKNKTEVVRTEFIRVLASLFRNCGRHSRLSDLAQLCDKDQDMDFWENILHLQVHRRARALLRLSSQLTSGALTIHPYVLVAYLVPIVSSFLFDSAYKKHVHVIDAAVETIGSIARFLPWPQYESLLRYYLMLLPKSAEHHKTTVKVVVALLNSFHFDLSNSRGVDWNIKKPEKEQNQGCDDTETMDESKKAADDNVEQEANVAGEVSECEEKKMKNKEQCKKSDVLDVEKATKIHGVIVKSILPQLHRSLMHKTKSDEEHKLAGKSYPEDEEILRVPIALAIVKLLQNLPHDSLKKNIPGLFLRMCQLLKSRSEGIRETARDTLVKMLQCLGPYYFPYLLHEMRGVMKKGYQVHVMTFTVSAILTNLTDQLKSGDLDDTVSDITEICMNEMFGDTAEEKEVGKFTGKLKEARSSKSYSLYEIVARFISESHLASLVLPLAEALNTCRNHKAVKKIYECLRHIASGLGDNSGIGVKGLLIFIYAIMNENVPQLRPQKKSKGGNTEPKYTRSDVYLIPKEPGRSGPPAKTSVKANAYVLVDFSLQILHLCLKRDRLKPSSKDHLEMLDPFVSVLAECLESSHIKVISSTLRCLIWIFKFSLPSLTEKAKHIVNSSFVIINKYAGIGMGQGENFEMVLMCFKMLTVIVRDTSYHEFSKDQLRVLLSYIEQDFHDHTRQATAFSLLKAILSKKLQADELPDLMNKISEMAIISDQEHIRTQCRQVSLQYLTRYPLGKNLQNSLSFYVSQLEYFHEHGRVSALEMINSLLHAFSQEVIKRHSGLFLIPLAARLVNDEASRCRKMAAQTIKSLLKKVDHDERNNLFSIAVTWMESKKLSHRRLGAQLCGIFAEVEGEHFRHHLSTVLPLFTKEFVQEREVEMSSHTDERCADHFLYHLLNAFTKILTNCTVIKEEKFSSEMDAVWDSLQRLILYPHLWVRLGVSQIYGLAFSSYGNVNEVVEALADEGREKSSNIFFASRQKLRDLSADFATQLQSPYLNESLGEQVVKNLVYLSRVISQLPDSGVQEDVTKEEEESGVRKTEVTLSWIVRRLCREVRKEVAHSPQTTVKRSCIFKYLAAISMTIDPEKLKPLLLYIFAPLCREVADASPNADETLKSLAQEVLNVLKNTLGVEEYTKIFASVQSSLIKKKVMRKRERVKEAVTNPEKYAMKKVKKQLNKKEAKKRKILQQKGKRKKAKKLKLSEMAIES